MRKKFFHQLKCLTILAAGLFASVAVCGQPQQQKPTVSDTAKTNVVAPAMTSSDTALIKQQLKVIRTAIRNAQRAYIRESCGTCGECCFTDADYEAFKYYKIAKNVANEIVTRKEIKEAILVLRKLPVDIREITKSLRKPLRKTWEQLGRITCQGTTEAGQKAEMDLANAVDNRVIQRFEDTSWQPVYTAK
jgi:hypothetical protein